VSSDSRTIERIEGNLRQRARDLVVDEAPLVITARGAEVMVVMRTPGADLELVRGLLHAEGLAAPARQVDADVVEVDLDPGAFARRALTATAACGVCGRAAIADLEKRARSVESEWQIEAELVASLPAKLRANQATFDATGGLHAAGLFDRKGALVAIREDVGRHNAVDKALGKLLQEGRVPAKRGPGEPAILVVSGRASFELVQKALAAGIPVLAAVGAPSSLAVELARELGLTLVGFLRDSRFNVYSGEERIG